MRGARNSFLKFLGKMESSIELGNLFGEETKPKEENNEQDKETEMNNELKVIGVEDRSLRRSRGNL